MEEVQVDALIKAGKGCSLTRAIKRNFAYNVLPPKLKQVFLEQSDEIMQACYFDPISRYPRGERMEEKTMRDVRHYNN